MWAHFVVWLELAVRWIHVIAGVAWIGTSFYFNWLNDALERPKGGPDSLEGEVWEVHGGGFYRAQKFSVDLERLPERLHWFKWEAYGTWISGFAMLVLVYYMGAEIYMVDPTVSWVGPREAVAIGIGSLLLSWLVYDRLCRTSLVDRSALFALLGLGLVTTLAYVLGSALGERAAFMHVGAAVGTLMAANVFRVIIPAHHELVEALEQGREPDTEAGRHAAMRSRHNNYFTLPVLFLMVSTHYPGVYGHEYGWALLAGIFVVGAGTRHYFNLRNQGQNRPWILVAAALGMATLAFLAQPSGLGGDEAGSLPGASDERTEELTGDRLFSEAQAVIRQRCTTCHARRPSHEGFSSPPNGVVMETPDQMRKLVSWIREQAVESRAMPPGNVTQITEEERQILDRWTQEAEEIPE